MNAPTRRGGSREAGFTIVEVVIAATLLFVLTATLGLRFPTSLGDWA